MPRILIIDDDAGVLTTLACMLEANDHDVVCTVSAREGLRLLSEEKSFDLVITDILMPDMDGIEVIREIRKLDSPPPVLGISGGGNMIAANDALAAARIIADLTLKKPFTIDELNGALTSVLKTVH